MGKFQEYLDEAEAKGKAKGRAESRTDGRNEGKNIGLAEGRLATLMSLYYKGRISLNDAAECMGESVDEIRALFHVDYLDLPLK